MKFFLRSVLLSLILIPGCKDPFDPALPFEESNFLVVEGYISVGENAVTRIKLSRTTPVAEGKVKPNEELGASIFILNDIDESYPVIERDNGIYSSDSLFLPLDRNYRLRIITANGRQYYSELRTPVISPEIDSVYWQFSDEGLTILMTTHDPLNQTDYYQWDYEEVWEERSRFVSAYTVVQDQFVFRDYEEGRQMRRCWKSDYPPTLMMMSVATLAPNTQIVKPIIFIPRASAKLDEKYAAVIKQHALSKEGYDYLRIMEKNTTQVGSFFDPLPSQLNSNISSTDSNDPVVGYIDVYTTSQKRIIIKPEELPEWTYTLRCKQIVVTNHPDSIHKYFVVQNYIPTTFSGSFGGPMQGAEDVCLDCRMRGGEGGTANKPYGWDD